MKHEDDHWIWCITLNKYFHTLYFITQKSQTLISFLFLQILYLYSTAVLCSKLYLFVDIIICPLLFEHYMEVKQSFKLESTKIPTTYHINFYWRFHACCVLHLMLNFWWDLVQKKHCKLSTILPLFMFLQAWYWVNRMTMLMLLKSQLK